MSNEIKIGDFYRTTNGLIRQVKTIKSGKRQFTRTTETLVNGVHRLEDIIKHSEDITDLIEKGDYVNGGIVTDYYFVGNQKVLVLNNEKISYEENKNFVPQLAIKSILTKEQFEQNCYRLEE